MREIFRIPHTRTLCFDTPSIEHNLSQPYPLDESDRLSNRTDHNTATLTHIDCITPLSIAGVGSVQCIVAFKNIARLICIAESPDERYLQAYITDRQAIRY